MKFFEPIVSLIDAFLAFFWMPAAGACSADDEALSSPPLLSSPPHATSASGTSNAINRATQRVVLMGSLPSL